MASAFDNRAARLKELLPRRPSGSPITAWADAAKLENATLARIAELEARVAALEGQPEPPAPAPTPPPPPQLAPQTYNRGSGGQDARYCVAGLGKDSTGAFIDAGGFRYDANGLSLGGRSGKAVAGLKPSDEMDGRGACDPYGPFPPWPAASYEV